MLNQLVQGLVDNVQKIASDLASNVEQTKALNDTLRDFIKYQRESDKHLAQLLEDHSKQLLDHQYQIERLQDEIKTHPALCPNLSVIDTLATDLKARQDTKKSWKSKIWKGVVWVITSLIIGGAYVFFAHYCKWKGLH